MSSWEEYTKSERWHFLLLARPQRTQSQIIKFILWNLQILSFCPCFVLNKWKALQGVLLVKYFMEIWIEKHTTSVRLGTIYFIQFQFISMHILSLLLITLATIQEELGD